MKNFRQILIAAVLAVGVFTTVIYSSCKNKCGSTTCQNGGTCEGNVCVCPEGFSGNACQTGWSDVLIGTYQCQRSSCHPAVIDTSHWQSAITRDATNPGFTIDISNFNNVGTMTIVATVDSNIGGVSNIRIAPSTGNTGIDAKGTYSNGVINLTFTTYGAGGVIGYTCSMLMTKE